MKRIVWFSNCIQSKGKNKASGSWLYSMSQLLISTGEIHLINITRGCNKKTQAIEHNTINERFEEYILPNWDLTKKGLPSAENCNKIKELCKAINPDIIHIWGVENYFCTLLPTLGLEIPLLLEIQGLHGPCADVYYGDLTILETIKCLGLRELLFPSLKSIYKEKARMKQLEVLDKSAIKKYNNISTQSTWVREHINVINSNANIYETEMSIREDFWNTHKWKYNTIDKDFYCSAAGPAPYKSIQTAIKALKIVTRYYPSTKLYIIGNFIDQNWIHQPGYLTFLKNMIKKLNLSDNIIFTGPLCAKEIVGIMHKCIGMVQTSYVESYSLAVAEAQAVGVPSIISYAGAMPELAKNYESGIFFSPGDYTICANKMIELINNQVLAEKLSKNAITIANERNNNNKVLEKQLEIYNQILNNG